MNEKPEKNSSPLNPEAFKAETGEGFTSDNDRIAKLESDPNRLVRFIGYDSASGDGKKKV